MYPHEPLTNNGILVGVEKQNSDVLYHTFLHHTLIICACVPHSFVVVFQKLAQIEAQNANS